MAAVAGRTAPTRRALELLGSRTVLTSGPVVLESKHAADAAAILAELGERVFEIGEIVEGTGKVVYR
jgi:hypothetical protein